VSTPLAVVSASSALKPSSGLGLAGSPELSGSLLSSSFRIGWL
jgi:hypothetical protein